ncbi:hypothetical protein [Paenibacillus elgii]|uniref:hypothetical protein n=1 Tax=Paenibacillus elgii TaxID=189691 RepID=UPI0013D59DF0|nr:hypothetical protein [Paenibacillus elgii]
MNDSIPSWTVWRHGGLRTSTWKLLHSTPEEQYARYIFRYFYEEMREGTIELRVDGIVREQLTKTRGESAKDREQQTRSGPVKDKYYPINTQSTFEPLAAANGVFGPIYQKYKTGELTYTDMLVESVIALADWNKVGKFLENDLWESGSEYFPTEKITTVREAKKQLSRYLKSSAQNMEQVGELIHLLFTDPAFEYLSNRIIQDISFMDLLIESK